MYYIDLYCVSSYIRPCTLSGFGIVVCLKISFYNSWISLRSGSLLRICARIIILCDVSFK